MLLQWMSIHICRRPWLHWEGLIRLLYSTVHWLLQGQAEWSVALSTVKTVLHILSAGLVYSRMGSCEIWASYDELCVVQMDRIGRPQRGLWRPLVCLDRGVPTQGTGTLWHGLLSRLMSPLSLSFCRVYLSLSISVSLFLYWFPYILFLSFSDPYMSAHTTLWRQMWRRGPIINRLMD